MYYLINTMSRTEDGHVGRVLSRHRTWEAAEKADARLQREVKRSNGQNSYLPTTIGSEDGSEDEAAVLVTIDAGDAWRA